MIRFGGTAERAISPSQSRNITSPTIRELIVRGSAILSTISITLYHRNAMRRNSGQ
jgi:hypothetical protein